MSSAVDTIDTILLPTDGSDGALAGAKRGLDLAVAIEADVHVLSVVDTSDLEGLSSIGETDVDEQKAAMKAEAQAAVDVVATMVEKRDAEIDVTTETPHGTVYRVINDYVDEVGIDAIAMGTEGRSGLKRVMLGSVTENVLRTVDVPVLAVPPGANAGPLVEETIENVLLPTDGSDGAELAVDWGVQLAETFNAMLHALYSADTSRFGGGAEPGEILTTLQEAGEDALDTVRERATEERVSVTGTVASGPPVRVIMDYVDTNGIDLIVIGTHGRSGVERTLLGSVTENVLRNADSPVFCVPMRAE